MFRHHNKRRTILGDFLDCESPDFKEIVYISFE